MVRNLFGWLLMALVTWQCAQRASPQGGPRDETPPEVTKTDPSGGTLFFKEKSVTFTFSEPMRRPTYDKEIFVSPFMQNRPEVRLSDNAKRVTIRFTEFLRPRTTYIITLNDVADNHEGNKLTPPYVLAFSTGSVLDSLELEGEIRLPTLGKTAEEMTVLLFDADSTLNNDFWGKRPSYLTKTQADGTFSFKYLRPDRYRLLGIKDGDQSNSLSQPNEQVALALDTVITLVAPVDSGVVPTFTLYAFLPDTKGPLPRGYERLTENTLQLKLSEWPRLDRLDAWVTDTLNENRTPLAAQTLYREGEEVFLLMGLPYEPPLDLHLYDLADSLGNSMDTVLRVSAKRIKKRSKPLLLTPKLRPEKDAWELLLPIFGANPWEDWINISDTSQVDSLRAFLDRQFSQDNFYLNITPVNAQPDTPYVLRLQGLAGGLTDSLLRDSIFTYKLAWWDTLDYGSLSGRVRIDSGYSGPIWVEMRGEDKEIVHAFSDTTFSFDRLKAGTYSFRVILDADSNRTWTPGALYPPRQPERIYEVSETVALRGNWAFEDHEVIVHVTDSTAVGVSKTGKKGAVSEADSMAAPGSGGKRPAGGPGGRGRRP